MAALRAGKHVLVEKPLAATYAEGRQLVEEAERRGLTLMCDHTYCYTPAVTRIRELLHAGELGDLHYLDSVRINLGLVQRDIDVLWDLAPHDLSILDFVLPPDVRPVAVRAHGADPIGAGRACVGYLTLQLNTGAIAHVHVNWLSPTKVRTTIIGGSKRTLVWDDLNPTQRLAVYDRGVDVADAGRARRRRAARHARLLPLRRHGRAGAGRARGAARDGRRVRDGDPHRHAPRSPTAGPACGCWRSWRPPRAASPTAARRSHSMEVPDMSTDRVARALVTGGAGTIGSHVVDQLVAAGRAEVVVLDNFVRGRRANLAWALANGAGDGSSRATSATCRLVRARDRRRTTWSSTWPRSASPSAPRSRGWPSRCWSTARSTCSRRRPRPACSKVVASSSASVYGLAEEFPTTERHHPYNNDTFYGAAKAFNEGMLRSFHAMYGLDYVALRYFNVYGPRMDIHGLYTEVLIRWMERIASGTPPLILGDGMQTMDFVHVADIARANILAAEADVTDDVFNVASGAETSLSELAHGAAARSWARTSRPEHGPARAVNGVTRRLADTTQAAGELGFKAELDLHEGLQRPRRRGGEREPSDGRRATARSRSSIPLLGEEEAQAAADAVRSGWVAQGPRVAEFEQAFAARGRRRARRRGQLVHHRPAPGAGRCSASGRATRSSCRRCRSSPPPTRCATSAPRRCSPTSSWPPATSPWRRSTRSAPRAPRRSSPCTRAGCPLDVARAARGGRTAGASRWSRTRPAPPAPP